jgi:hypothetical protein
MKQEAIQKSKSERKRNTMNTYNEFRYTFIRRIMCGGYISNAQLCVRSSPYALIPQEFGPASMSFSSIVSQRVISLFIDNNFS